MAAKLIQEERDRVGVYDIIVEKFQSTMADAFALIEANHIRTDRILMFPSLIQAVVRDWVDKGFILEGSEGEGLWGANFVEVPYLKPDCAIVLGETYTTEVVVPVGHALHREQGACNGKNERHGRF